MILQDLTPFSCGLQLTWNAGVNGDSLSEKLSPALEPFKGGACPVMIQYRSAEAQATVRLGDEWRVFATDELLLRFKRQLGNEAVEVKYR
ncbi:MAG: hypothetical protein ACU83V_00520 [Gammaproteobacteria bacterium]